MRSKHDNSISTNIVRIEIYVAFISPISVLTEMMSIYLLQLPFHQHVSFSEYKFQC